MGDAIGEDAVSDRWGDLERRVEEYKRACGCVQEWFEEHPVKSAWARYLSDLALQWKAFPQDMRAHRALELDEVRRVLGELFVWSEKQGVGEWVIDGDLEVFWRNVAVLNERIRSDTSIPDSQQEQWVSVVLDMVKRLGDRTGGCRQLSLERSDSSRAASLSKAFRFDEFIRLRERLSERDGIIVSLLYFASPPSVDAVLKLNVADIGAPYIRYHEPPLGALESEYPGHVTSRLKGYLGRQKIISGPAFRVQSGRSITRQQLNEVIRRGCAGIGLPVVGPHHLLAHDRNFGES